MINPQSVQTLVLNIQDNLTTLANSLGDLGDSFNLYMAAGEERPLIDSSGVVWVPNGFNNSSFSSVMFNDMRDLYPMYPHLWRTSFSTDWTFTLPVPNGVYQLKYWWLDPNGSNTNYIVSLSLNGVLIETNLDVYNYCGGNRIPRSKVYPTFQVTNNVPIIFSITEDTTDTPVTAFELHKIGELP